MSLALSSLEFCSPPPKLTGNTKTEYDLIQDLAAKEYDVKKSAHKYWWKIVSRQLSQLRKHFHIPFSMCAGSLLIFVCSSFMLCICVLSYIECMNNWENDIEDFSDNEIQYLNDLKADYLKVASITNFFVAIYTLSSFSVRSFPLNSISVCYGLVFCSISDIQMQ